MSVRRFIPHSSRRPVARPVAVDMNVPIIGEEPQGPPEGLYVYHLPVLIQRAGEHLEADAFEINTSVPIVSSHQLTGICEDIARQVKAREPERPDPKVVAQAFVPLNFIPREIVERLQAAQAEEAAKAQTPEQAAAEVEGLGKTIEQMRLQGASEKSIEAATEHYNRLKAQADAATPAPAADTTPSGLVMP